MVRRMALCAGLLALLISVSACACGRGTAAPAKGAGATGNAACLPAPCVRGNDCTACYHSEADMNTSRLNDDLPSGGGCCDCGPHVRHHHVAHDPCAPCGR